MSTEDDVRRIALSLPGTTEKPSYGAPEFRVHDRVFARVHDTPGLIVVWVANQEAREELLRTAPGKFTTSPDYDGHRSVLVRLDAVGVSELEEVLGQAWWVRAPGRLRAGLDGPPSPA